MRKIDYHIHTHFSTDSEAQPREHILKANKDGKTSHIQSVGLA